MKILMAFADWSHTPERKKQNTYGGLGYYRIVKPSEQIREHQVTVVGQEITAYGSSLEDQWDNIFKGFDVFWTSYFSNAPIAAAIFYHAQKHGKKVILDIDDNYLDIPESNLLYDKFQEKKHDRAFLSASLSLADAISVSTVPLQQRLDQHFKERHGLDKKFIHIPNMNDLNDWQVTPAPLHQDRFVIGYSGSNSHRDDFAMVIPAIRDVMKKHKHVWFEVMGLLAMEDLKNYLYGFTDDMLMRVALVGATPTFKEYPSWLAERPWNVGIAPLVDTPFTRSKSHIKWMEYTMVGMPVVASRVYPYQMPILGRDTILDGHSGILCDRDQWYEVLDDMVNHYDRYRQISKNAYEQIKTQWQYKDMGNLVDKALSTI